jgi:hypothetical protein
MLNACRLLVNSWQDADYMNAGREGGMPNQALEQTRDSVLRYGEVVGCELLNFFVRS